MGGAVAGRAWATVGNVGGGGGLGVRAVGKRGIVCGPGRGVVEVLTASMGPVVSAGRRPLIKVVRGAERSGPDRNVAIWRMKLRAGGRGGAAVELSGGRGIEVVV